MTTSEQAADAKTLTEFAAATAEPHEPESGAVYAYLVPPGWGVDVQNYERLDDEPRRVKGTTVLHDAESFVRLTQEHAQVPMSPGGLLAHEGDTPGEQAKAKNDAAKIYGDFDNHEFTAVFNDCFDRDNPGWADHRARLGLRFTEEWMHWTSRDDDLMDQETFARHIEDGYTEVVEPDAASMLELAQTFHAHTDVRFGQSHLLASGERQFQFQEQTTATAGRQGEIKVPTVFVLGIAPFEGTQPYSVTARLRYHVRDQKLAIGYKLIRPKDVLRAAFNDVRTEIEELTTLKVLLASSPR